MAITMKITPRKLSIKDFKILKTLGSGGFGTCKKALYKNHIVCIKQINETSKREAAKQSFQAETKIEFFKFQHENIVKLLAVSQPASLENFVKTNELFMIFEYIEGRNLQSLIDDENEDINLKRMCRFGSDIASALSYVHASGIVHLDLKPANIMVTQGDVCKLADFGCSQYLNETSTPRSLLTGTCAYRAPELYKAKSPTTKCDIYALGICLWQFWSREFPFAQMDQQSVIFQVVKYNLRPSFDVKKVNKSYKKLATQCWSPEPEKRPGTDEVADVLSNLINV